MSELFIKDDGDSVEVVAKNSDNGYYYLVGQIDIDYTKKIHVCYLGDMPQKQFDEFIALYEKKKKEWEVEPYHRDVLHHHNKERN